MGLRETIYTDERGRKYLVHLPDDVSDDQASLGVRLGPPDVVDELNLPEPQATQIHNELFNRRLFSLDDVKKYAGILESVIKTVYRADVQNLFAAYQKYSKI